MPLLDYETKAGAPIQAGDVKLIPLAKSVKIAPPGMFGGLVWNRPAAVIVQQPDGQETVLPIQDVTRQAQIALLAMGALGSLLIWLMFKK